MMSFIYTYRDKSGAKFEATIEAASREAAFAALKTKGISPIAIREGGRVVAPRPPQVGRDDPIAPQGRAGTWGACPCRARRRVLAFLGTLVFLAILGGGAWWWLGRTEAGKSRIENQGVPVTVPTMPKAVNDVTPAKPQSQTEPSPAATNGTSSAISAQHKAEDTFNGIPVVSRVATTNEDGGIFETVVTADGKEHAISHMPPPIFKHQTDELLAMVVVSNSSSLPPLPDISGIKDDDFIESLSDPIVVDDSDSERVRKTKEIVREARKEMKALLASGMTFKEAILQHRELFNENMSMRDAAIIELRQLEKEDTPENVKRYRDKINKALEQMGIEPIKEKPRRKKNEESE